MIYERKSRIIEATMAAMSYLTALLLLLFCSVPQLDAIGCETGGTGGYDCHYDCNVIIRCDPSGFWNVTNCLSSGKVCNAGACVTDDDYCTGNYPTVYCNLNGGKFPNPSDCTSFYDCTTQPAELKRCVGSRFNPCTRACDLPLNNGVCQNSPVGACTSATQTLAVPGTDSYYYRCRREGSGFAFSVEICPEGTRFSARTGTCQDVGNIQTCSVCGNSSVTGPRPHGSTSCRYIWCYSETEFSVRQCTTGWHYEHSQRGCVYGSCS